MDVPSLLIGLLIGGAIIGGATGAYLYFSRKNRGELEYPASQVPAKDLPLRGRNIDRAELEKARKELRTHLLEKELSANALTRLYEAEAEGRITKEQRDQLSLKYREQLKSLEDRLGNFELLIEVGELENLRTELTALFEGKVKQLDERLDRAKSRLDHIIGFPKPQVEKQPEEKQIEKSIEKPKAKGESEVDDRVRELREEVLEALARLEQMDIEG